MPEPNPENSREAFEKIVSPEFTRQFDQHSWVEQAARDRRLVSVVQYILYGTPQPGIHDPEGLDHEAIRKILKQEYELDNEQILEAFDICEQLVEEAHYSLSNPEETDIDDQFKEIMIHTAALDLHTQRLLAGALEIYNDGWEMDEEDYETAFAAYYSLDRDDLARVYQLREELGGGNDQA